MPDFFVRENPLLNLSSDKDRERLNNENATYIPSTLSESAPHVLLDYGEFGFPDEQVVREWTFLGCLTAIFTCLALLMGICILGYTVYNMYHENTAKPNSAQTYIATKVDHGFKRTEGKAFSVDCHWNYPNAVGVTPDGRYLITGGGPRTRSEDSLPTTRRTNEETFISSGQGSLEISDELSVPGKVRLLSYDSSMPAQPASPYYDYLNLGKNGKRLIDSYNSSRKQKKNAGNTTDFADDLNLLDSELNGEKSENELEDDNINYLELLADTSNSSLADIDILHRENDESSVWKKTRPSVESYPMAFWSIETMQPLVVHWNHEFPIVAIAVSQDGTKVVSVDNGGNAILWSLDNLPGENGLETPTWHFVNKMTPRMRQAQHMGKVQAIHAVTFTPSGRQFVMAATVDALDETGNPYSTCGALILWDIENWSEVLRQRGAGGISEKIDTYYQTFNPVGKFCDLTYTPNGKYLIAAAAGANAGVYYFNNRTNNPAYGICMADLQSEEQRPRTSVTSEFKPNLVQGVSHHDFPNAEMVSITIAPADPNNPEKKPLTIVSADNYGRIVFWDFAPRPNRPREGVTCRNYWSMKNSEHTTRNIRDILYSQDEKFVMVLGDDILLFSGRRPHDYVGTFRLTNDNSVSTLRNDYFLVSGFFTQDNKYFFGGGDDCMLRIWRVDEMPIDSRFLAERPGETTSDEDKATLENIQKELMARGNIGSRDDSDEDEKDWERRVERKNSKPFETDTSIPPRVTGDDASMFRDED